MTYPDTRTRTAWMPHAQKCFYDTYPSEDGESEPFYLWLETLAETINDRGENHILFGDYFVALTRDKDMVPGTPVTLKVNHDDNYYLFTGRYTGQHPREFAFPETVPALVASVSQE